MQTIGKSKGITCQNVGPILESPSNKSMTLLETNLLASISQIYVSSSPGS